MKSFAKLTFLISLFLFFLAYTSAGDVRVEFSNRERIESSSKEREKPEIKKEEKQNWIEKIKDRMFKNNKEEKQSEIATKRTQKSGTTVSCDQKPGFVDKINQIKKDSIGKINTLENLNKSLQDIIPLVKNASIKKNLEQQKNAIIVMKSNYNNLKNNISKNPQIACQENFILKKYNEETKKIIENIKKQFLLLKK